MPLPAALEHERKVAIESAKATTAATIASRRDDVHDRGRKG
jgi:hypothetical protein